MVILIDNVDYAQIINKKFKQSEAKIFSFNIYVHKKLSGDGIKHEIAENYLSIDDRTKLFDLVVSYYDWYKANQIFKNLEFEGVNLLGLLDTAELHQHLLANLLNFLIIKRIITKEKPKKIIVTANLLVIVKSITSEKNIEILTHENNSNNYLAWDRIQIKFNLGRIPISFYVSRSTYVKIKNIIEHMLSNILNLRFNFKDKRKTILLLEFNPSIYQDFLSCLGKSDRNIILLNRRRSALWNIESTKILHKSGCKIVDLDKLVDPIKDQIKFLIDNYTQKLEDLWSNDDFFTNLFMIEGHSFWDCIKDTLIHTYRKRISEYVKLVLSSKRLFETANISCIVSLNVVGETEKAILSLNSNNIPSLMLEHGFANYTEKLSRFDILSNYPLLQDKIAVWGTIQKNYLTRYRNFSSDRIIISGSPRHDSFFNNQKTKTLNQQKTILLTIVPIGNNTGQCDTNTYIKFENFIKSFYQIIIKLNNVKLIVKLHPAQAEHNEDIKELFNQIDPTIPVYQLNSILDLIQSCDVLVNINPESCDSSTVILEAFILEKPTITVFLDNQYHDLEFIKNNSTLSISDETNLEKNLHDILFNQEFRNRLIQHSKEYVKDYLNNHGNASLYLSNIINSY